MHFGERIKELRESQGLLQRQLAANLEIDTPMFSKIERGERNAKREQVIALAKLLNANEDELLTIWLSDKIIENVGDETAALAALKHAEQELKKKSK
ncbi:MULTISPECIES: helix-turn-helix transcriptional regulator [Cytophagales]|uniref:helix-turn-helix domain-containing protein n=1 Tax=Cytophagales TaxID=768507 RepID=UPI0023D9E5E5|nr:MULTISPECIES: helix-turn-helix transcriptional regulator [Cytophagales]MDF2157891.1 helix-turn-helix transcriptional regulator [Algoriphagus sp. CAU 1675]HET8861254.1 helix-turn-helix transcriptional regulator [Marivirga sp.]